MIGMMYLVLTALLALNVSAEVLNAFELIDESLRTATSITESSIGDKAGEFEKAMEVNPKGTKKWFDASKELTAAADTLFNEIQHYKVKLITTLEGKSEEELIEAYESEHGGHGEGGQHVAIEKLLKKKDDNNVGGQIFILEGGGVHLKEYIDNYRNTLIQIIDYDTAQAAQSVKAREAMKRNINATLYTGKFLGHGGDSVPWEVTHFEHLPAAGVVSLMSKMQGDVRNLQSQVYSFLLNQIGKTDMKFNKIEAIVNSPSSYVLRGQPYEASIFIAAYDSNATPEIIVNGSPITVENGRGVYNGNTSSVGPKSFSGVIKLLNKATGITKEYPFKSEYTVGEAAISVSPTKMNVFYIGVDNPVEVTASGVPSEKVRVSISTGSISKVSGNNYKVRVKRQGKVNIRVSAEIDGQVKSFGTREFRVKRVPDPVAVVGRDAKNKRGGTIATTVLLAQPGVKAELENFDFDMRFTVTSFIVSATVRGFTEEYRSNSAAFTSQQKQLIRQVGSGKKVYIENIMARGPDGSTRKLGSIAFRLR